MASRLDAIKGHMVQPKRATAAAAREFQPGDEVRVPVPPQSALSWNGWGYVDAGFELNADGQIWFKGEMCVRTLPSLPLLYTHATARTLAYTPFLRVYMPHTLPPKQPPPLCTLDATWRRAHPWEEGMYAI